jgi:hypothetical protein
MSFIKDLARSKKPNQTVFTFSDLGNAVAGYTGAKLRSALKYAVSQKDLVRLSKGVYALSDDYSRLEFANKYRSPSYISLYTILQKAGLVFQPYPSIYVVSNRTEDFEINGQKYIYRKIKNQILLNPLGITNNNHLYEATPERALCDKLYLDGSEYFDNLRDVNWKLMRELNLNVYEGNRDISTFIQKYSK